MIIPNFLDFRNSFPIMVLAYLLRQCLPIPPLLYIYAILTCSTNSSCKTRLLCNSHNKINYHFVTCLFYSRLCQHDFARKHEPQIANSHPKTDVFTIITPLGALYTGYASTSRWSPCTIGT